MKWFKRPPDFKIRENYLHRWWLIPRNRVCNIYLHHMMESDDNRALHDHPWHSLSIILKGKFLEITEDNKSSWRKRGQVVFRRATLAHRLELLPGEEAWTLFITGPKIREWGFHCLLE